MLKKLLVMIALSMGGHVVSAATESFTDADWAGIPMPGELSVEEVMGRLWDLLKKADVNGHWHR